MMELDPKYATVIVKRFYQNCPDQPIFRNGKRIDQGIEFKNMEKPKETNKSK